MDNHRGGGGMSQRNGSATSHGDLDDELIPTAIVIKNIPFAVRKEQLMQLMSDMSLPLPYAFNYHFDNGVFRGLAFANFTSPDETASVIEHLNMYELQGRKLRVEYKKMLPLEQRERIEREKRQRRGQLEEQHRPMQPSQLHSFPSMSSIGSHPPPSTSPNPVQMPTLPPSMCFSSLPRSEANQMADVDMNDPLNFKWYNEMMNFKNNGDMEVHIFEPGLLPTQRRVIHTMAHHLGLNHYSSGEGDKRQVHVTRLSPARMSPPNPGSGISHISGDAARGRVLNRAATTEGFNDNRHVDAATYNSTLRGQTSLNLLPERDIFGNTPNLRAAKSYADLRSYTPSPVYSTTSMSNGANALRLQQMDGSTGQNTQTPLLTPAASHQTLGSQRDENILVNGFGGMSLGTSIANAGSPRRLRTMFSWDQENQQPNQQQQQQNPATAPIGSNRTIGSNADGRTQPLRQPANPATDRGAGFRRPNGHQTRGSDEYRNTSTPEIIVE